MSEIFTSDGVLSMTFLALNLSHYVNSVAGSRAGRTTTRAGK